ncbi:MAG: siroheme synthase CysG [Rhizobiaceae bacterium]
MSASKTNSHPSEADRSAALDVFPAFFNVAAKRVVIVGGGDEAAAKLRLLSETSAKLEVIAPHTTETMDGAIKLSGALHHARQFEFEDLADAALVFTAMESEPADALVVEAARMVGVPVNAVDRPHLCDFITPAIVNRAPVVVAISTNGTAPVLARRIKGMIEKVLHPRTGSLARFADAFRRPVAQSDRDGRARRLFWERFFDGPAAASALEGDMANACASARDLLAGDEDHQGHVALVGAGPGAEDLLTLRAHKVLQDADVVMHDALVPLEIVRMSRRDAEIIAVGKRKGCHSKSQEEINALLVEKAKQGLKVVRLKSGDPMIFGRAGEEIATLRSHEISYEIVPGVTSALAGAAEAEIPLTLRGTASSVVFTTGHDLNGKHLPDWAQLALSGATISVYMGRTVARQTAARLLLAGLAPDTPVAVLENVSRSDSHSRRLVGTLSDLQHLQDEKSSPAAALIIIGEAVAAVRLDLCQPIIEAEPIQTPNSVSNKEGLAA